MAAILDVCSRRVVGWSMSEQRDEQLVRAAFQMAVISRRPKEGLLHHSDRGSQYTSPGYQALLKQYGIEVSMSRKGNCSDNAMMESFFGTLKEEWVERHCFQSRREARAAPPPLIIVPFFRMGKPCNQPGIAFVRRSLAHVI